MADHTKIEWTDATWNPITGCSVVSAGCKHCYAMKLAGASLASPGALDEPMQRLGKKLAGRLLDGVEHNEYPAWGAK